MNQATTQFEKYLEERFALLHAPQNLKEAMEYSLFSDGKRIRPLLCMATEALNGTIQGTKSFPLAMAIEMVHTYSLIHDDLPAMDDDDIRRGKPSNHIAFGEAMAILAGDGLLTQSFEVLSDLDIDSKKLKKICIFFSRCAGINGMVGGQVLDLTLDVTREHAVTIEEMQAVHRKKTGKLIELSILGTAVIIGLKQAEFEVLEDVAKIIGILFQAVDDLKDDDETTGKTQNIDVINGKVTYITLLGKKRTSDYVENLASEAKKLLHTLEDHNTEMLEQIIEKIIA
ncbi:geranyltranstransferase [Erysipelotrichaceae bacterium]|nr:geranyltranstransferase [Erysipelotrichaceae bacterium]